MKKFACSILAFAGLLLLALGSVPGTLSGQSQTQDKTPSSSTASAAPSGSVEACLDTKKLTEQLNRATRINTQELQAQLAGLQDKIAKVLECPIETLFPANEEKVTA
jgi:hypothetical protein